jgi:hypothetical protein
MNLPKLSLLLLKSGDGWSVIALEHCVAAAGKSPEEAALKFLAQLASQLSLDEYAGIAPLEDTPPAPDEYWERYRMSKAKLVFDLNDMSAALPDVPAGMLGDMRLAA